MSYLSIYRATRLTQVNEDSECVPQGNAASKAETVFYLTQTPNSLVVLGVYLICTGFPYEHRARSPSPSGVLPFSRFYRDSSSDHCTCTLLVTKQLVHGAITPTIRKPPSKTVIYTESNRQFQHLVTVDSGGHFTSGSRRSCPCRSPPRLGKRQCRL